VPQCNRPVIIANPTARTEPSLLKALETCRERVQENNHPAVHRGATMIFNARFPSNIAACVCLATCWMQAIAADYPTLTVEPVVADFNEPFADLPGTPGERLIVFLGGTIGNFDDDERAAFLKRMADALAPGDHFLLGADLVKPPSRLIAAYDDRSGITAEFNRNLIEVLRAELDAEGLYVDDFQHVARWNPTLHRVEMWLRARRDVSVHFNALNRDWTLPEGAEMLTEISVKFRLPELQDELRTHGLERVESWTDSEDDYSLTLAVKR